MSDPSASVVPHDRRFEELTGNLSIAFIYQNMSFVCRPRGSGSQICGLREPYFRSPLRPPLKCIRACIPGDTRSTTFSEGGSW